MAVSTINPWSAGAVVFDQRPFQAFYERQMARRQAKEDALDNYFKDLNKNLTSTGMRAQDVPSLLRKQGAQQEFFIQNKSAILNPTMDNGDAYTRYMAGHQDAMATINESKAEAKKDQELAKLRFNPEAKHIFDDPKFIEDKQLDDLPIDDPRRKRFDLMTNALPPKPIDVKELDAYNKYLVGGIQFDKVPGQTENIGGFKTRTPIYTQYSPQNQMKIGSNAANAYDTDKRWRLEAVKFFDEITHNPGELDRYNKVYQSLYGSEIDNPREAWIAKGIADNNMKATEYKEGKDEKALLDYKFAQDKVMEGIRFGHQKQLKKEDQNAVDNWIVNYWGQRFADAKSKEPVPLPGPKTPTLTYKMGYQLDPDQVMSEALKKNGVYADEVFITGKNKILPVYYKREKVYYEDGKLAGTEIIEDENGNPVVDEILSRPMELDQAYLSMGYRGQTKKDLGGTMTGAYQGGQKEIKSDRKYNINGKTYSHDQLLKMYPEEKIKEYIEAGIIK